MPLICEGQKSRAERKANKVSDEERTLLQHGVGVTNPVSAGRNRSGESGCQQHARRSLAGVGGMGIALT